ncbi:MAG TPA: SRPBCC domain-containing protein [Acidimicrobiales bacterium]
MNDQSLTISFLVDQSPEEVFAAINDVRGWWTGEIEGCTDKLGEVFTYSYQDLHRSTQKITELIPGKKVSWLVVDACLSFVENTDEWIGTEVTFDISKEGNGTEVRFTHDGLVSDFECFDACSNGWNFYIEGSLRSLLSTGKGEKANWESATTSQ